MVGSATTKELVTMISDESLCAASDNMTSNQIGRLPVIEQRGRVKLIGIITQEDIARVYDIDIRSRLEEVELSRSVEENSEPHS